MNRFSIANLLPGLTGANNDGEVMDVDKPETWAPKSGPAKQRWLTNGQLRRLQGRREAAQQRKSNNRFRREWMRNQHATAALRGQLQVVGAVSFADEEFQVSPWSHLHSNARRQLTSKYGSVEKAAEHYEGILAEARR